MKKIVLLLSITLLSVSCGLVYRDCGLRWFIYNDTEQTLKLRVPSYSASDKKGYRVYEIEPQNREQIDGYGGVPCESDHKFDDYFQKCANLYGVEACWQILSEDDVVLKTWNYVDFSKPNQRFFNELSWSSNSSNAIGYTNLTFAIKFEDIE
jgi:hypothetical protein